MADSTTSNLLLTKPEVGASTDTWGSKINTDLDSVDAVFAANGTGTSVGLNVGSGKTLKVAGTTDFSANLTFTGTGNRITGDFSNATIANRVMFQSSTTNGNTLIGAIPNGTGQNARIQTFASSDPTNTATLSIESNSSISQAAITSGITGSGTYLPMTFYTGGSERVRVDTSGNVGIGVTPSAWAFSGSQALQVKNASFAGYLNRAYVNANLYFNSSGSPLYIASDFATQYVQINGENRWYTAPSGTAGNAISFTQAMTLDSSGNLLVGASSSTWLGSLLKSGGTITLASGASINLSSAVCGGAIVSVYVVGSGNGGLFYLNYSAVAAKITGDGTATDTGSDFAVYKSAASHTSTLKNKSVSTQTFSVVVVAGQLS